MSYDFGSCIIRFPFLVRVFVNDAPRKTKTKQKLTLFLVRFCFLCEILETFLVARALLVNAPPGGGGN